MGETETVFVPLKLQAAHIQDDMRPTAVATDDGLWQVRMEFMNTSREGCTTPAGCLQELFMRTPPVSHFEQLELPSTAIAVRKLGRQAAIRDHLATDSMYMFISVPQLEELMRTGTLRCPFQWRKELRLAHLRFRCASSVSMHVYRSSNGCYNDMINHQFRIVFNPTRGRTEADLLAYGPTAATQFEKKSCMQKISYKVRQFSLCELEGMTIAQSQVNMRRWMPPRQDYEEQFHDELSREDYERLNGPPTSFGNGEFDDVLPPKVRCWGRIHEPHDFYMSDEVAEDVRSRMRVQWYHSMGSMLCYTLQKDELFEYAEQCFKFMEKEEDDTTTKSDGSQALDHYALP